MRSGTILVPGTAVGPPWNRAHGQRLLARGETVSEPLPIQPSVTLRDDTMPRLRALLIGAGGFGSAWVNDFLPAMADRVVVTGLVDIDPDTLRRAGDSLGLRDDQRFTSMADGFARAEADFCIVVVQPMLRLDAVRLAIAHGLPVLAEKPLADSWDNALEILRLVREADLKLAVVQNYRYTRRVRTLRSVLTDGTLGRLNYVTARFAADYTPENAGGAFRHQIPYAMLYEGAVHHLDQLRNLTGSEASTVSGYQWNPAWSTFANDTTLLLLVRMANGVVCQYENNHVARGTQNGWHEEAYRLECEHGAVTLGRDHTVRLHEHLGGGRLRTTEIAPLPTPLDGHPGVIADFVDWVSGGPAPPTAIEDNIRTMGLTFGAIDAVRDGITVDVAAKTAAGLATIARPA